MKESVAYGVKRYKSKFPFSEFVSHKTSEDSQDSPCTTERESAEYLGYSCQADSDLGLGRSVRKLGELLRLLGSGIICTVVFLLSIIALLSFIGSPPS
jgi:hypothetical protein